MKMPSQQTTLRIAAVLTLIALALMAWSVVVPAPLPIMLAMTVGQVIGTVAFALYGWVVLRDLRKTPGTRTGDTDPPPRRRE